MAARPSTRIRIQYGALPWRRSGGVVEVLLVTTRNTRRWIVPKGWPLANLTPSECAAAEALEEAGVVGEVAEAAVGSYRYRKRRKSGAVVHCKVHVFTLEVAKQRDSWPEKGLREMRWCTIPEALASVAFAGLRQILAKFERSISPGAPASG